MRLGWGYITWGSSRVAVIDIPAIQYICITIWTIGDVTSSCILKRVNGVHIPYGRRIVDFGIRE